MHDHDFELILIGDFDLRFRGESLALPRACQRLIAMVALADRPLPRSRIGGRLWPESTEDRANSCVRSTLWRMPEPAGCSPLVIRPTHVGLAPDVRVDHREFRTADAGELATRVMAGGSAPYYAEDLLPEWDGEWLFAEREEFRRARLRLLDAVAEKLYEAGQYTRALQIGRLTISSDPLRESSYRLAARSHLRLGNIADAMRECRTYEELLDAELGLRPSGEMVTLVAECMRA